MEEKKCLFCQIGDHKEPADFVLEDDEFICIKNKYPAAPIHLLVMPRKHVSKSDLALGVTDVDFWDKIMGIVFRVVRQEGLDKSGYKLVNNGAGYNHFDHEHIHVLGGTKGEPGGNT